MSDDKLGEIAERLAEDIGWAQGPILAALQQARDLGREEAQAEVERLRLDVAASRHGDTTPTIRYVEAKLASVTIDLLHAKALREAAEVEVERLRAAILMLREQVEQMSKGRVLDPNLLFKVDVLELIDALRGEVEK